MTSHEGRTSDDPLIGSMLAGRYRIEERVGAGAMGAVYRATQAGLGRAVALKVLRRDMAWGGDTIQRFRREAKAMSALNHPNTVRVFDFGSTEDGLLFLAMEMLEGEPATDYLFRSGRLDARDAVLFAQDVLRSIAEAHAKGIVHRDLKPDNIFFARVEGRSRPMLKVLDFGIAKAIEGDRKIDQFETLDGTVFGTPRYMSPEQAAGKALDPRSDLYSVGILLYEFLAGDPPFVDADAVVVMAKHIREQPVPLSRAVPERMIPRSLEAIVNRALEKDPSKRWQSAEDFDRALEASLPDIERLSRMSFARVQHTVRGRFDTTSFKVRAFMLLGLSLFSAALASVVMKPAVDPQAPSASAPIEVTVPGAVAAAPSAASTPNAAGIAARPSIVHLQSTPADAEVMRDGLALGVTPLDIVLTAGSDVSVSLHKDGFGDQTVRLRASEPATLVMLTPVLPPPKATARSTLKPRSRHRKNAKPTQSPLAPTAPPASSLYEKF